MPLTADTEGFTDLAFGPEVQMQQPNMPNRHGLYVEFYMHPVQDKAETIKAGRPIYNEKPYVMIMVPGDKASIIRRPIRTGQKPGDDNNRFHNEYVAFKQNVKQPVLGQPLGDWIQVTRSQVEEMKHFGIHTVEQLAGVPDAHTQKYMGLGDLKRKAREYLETKASEQPIVALQAEVDSRDKQMASMEATMQEMSRELAELKKGK